MSPVPTLTQDQRRVQPTILLPFRGADPIVGSAKEIVVDWQLSSETDRRDERAGEG